MGAPKGNKNGLGCETSGRPMKYKTVEELAAKIDAYFDWCDSMSQMITNDKGQVRCVYKPYTISGLCLFLDFTRETLNEYQKIVAFSDTITRAKFRIESWLEEKSLLGETNPQVSMFNLKNNFGWVDKTEVKQDVNASITFLPPEIDKFAK